jgi:hypothetical protein
MNLLSVDALAPPLERTPPRDRAGRTLFRTLIASTLLCGGLAAQPADASLQIITTGTITLGSETGGLFGLPPGMTSLIGDSYTLVVHYDYLGPGYFTTGDGTAASDFEVPGISGYVTAIINGVSLTTQLTNSLLGTFLTEDMFDFSGLNQGSSGSGDNVNVTQSLTCNFLGNPCIPYADLMAHVNYVPGPLDTSGDQYTFQAGGVPFGNPPNATFIGTETSFALTPEPPSWVLLATGLLGLGTLVRRRYG